MSKVIRKNVPRGYLVGYKAMCSEKPTRIRGSRQFYTNPRDVIATVLIPTQSHAMKADFNSREGGDTNHSGKCRASMITVLSLEDKKTGRPVKKAYTTGVHRDCNIITYKVGKSYKPAKPFSKKNVACASGINFFMDKESAVDF